MYLNVNRRSAVERLEETKAHYVKTERVLDCKQNFDERDGSHTNTERLDVKFDHSDFEENSLEPSDESFTVEEDVTEIEYKKQSSRTSDYSKIAHVSPSASANSNFGEKTKPVTRSKSDVSCRFSKNNCVAPEPDKTTDTELERFFNTMGLDSNMFKNLTAPPRSPVHFFESVSSENSETNLSSAGSEDSALEVQKEGLKNSDLQKHAPTETSIVEKNARVVKWLL
ncbi:uncharacterized protein CEXT_111971 [Caerostris extrusa]|uniref:Centrosome-associated FAM110 C-terminal domain-containing protein n=1 Tax=Caerostris extrusa TaxID=172846 RepID=A0AAV4MAB8_CAEEX|nr:uncharacterized protein CEXT_111971 [Caerostris extrusa]